jgi:hypothetical protein
MNLRKDVRKGSREYPAGLPRESPQRRPREFQQARCGTCAQAMPAKGCTALVAAEPRELTPTQGKNVTMACVGIS